MSFHLLNCSWPRPVEQANGRWTSEPEWDAPLMPTRPEARWEIVDGQPCWTIDWRDRFRGGLKNGAPFLAGEMWGFHVVFRVEVRATGTLDFWDDDGCIIRRDGRVVHEDRSAHQGTRHELEVRAGDRLEVAQWQFGGDWFWGGRVRAPGEVPPGPVEVLGAYLDAVRERLRRPEGPVLKLYTSGATPLRAALAVYSLVLNGYAPASIDLHGAEQWSPRACEVFAALLPFAQVVPAGPLLDRARALGGRVLAEWATQHWFVMKALVALLAEPTECAMIDDDVLVLGRVDDALAAFRDHDLVYIPDKDSNDGYLRAWRAIPGLPAVLPTKRFNAGLYWVRSIGDPRHVVTLAQRARPGSYAPFDWEQGLIACLYAHRPTRELPRQRYFYPLFDGLPGGLHGYDYANNPCGFTSIHFGGLAEKPTDGAALHLAPSILGRAAEHAMTGLGAAATAGRSG